jgi:beta-phosphoglucomutase
MIKAIIFDLDGVLVDATEWHYEALNKALKLFGFEINREMHVGEYNGLPTRKKLEMLSVQKGYPRELHEFTNKLKQNYTKDVILLGCKPYFEKQLMLSKLKAEGYTLVVCSNSIRESIELMLKKSGIIDYFDFFIGNDEGFASKPAPDIYLHALKKLDISANEAVIVEDAPHGIAAAKASGAHTCEVEGFHEVNYDRVKNYVKGVDLK